MKQMVMLPFAAAMTLAGACTVSGSLFGKTSSSSPSTSSQYSPPPTYASAPTSTQSAGPSASSSPRPEATTASTTVAPRTGAPNDFITERCTILGTVNPRCLEVWGYPQPSAPLHARGEGNQQSIKDCFKSLSYMFKPETPTGNFDIGAWSAIGKFNAEVKSGQYPKLTADPGTVECLAIANKLTKGRLDHEYAWRLEHPRIQPTFSDVFGKQCNRHGDLEEQWYPGRDVKVVLFLSSDKERAKVAKDKRTALSGTNPPYTIRCNGEVIETLADGTKKVTEPWVQVPTNKTYLSRKDQCIETCRFVAGRPRTCDADTSSRLCKDDCERRCL